MLELCNKIKHNIVRVPSCKFCWNNIFLLMQGESSSSTSTDNDKKNIIKRNSKRERGDSFVLRNKSFTEDDDDFPEGLKEPEDEDTSMTFI
jgi:phage terminase large subunit